MKVSVIIPGYRTEFINETLQSVFSQTVPAHEVLYVQDSGVAAQKINRLASIATGDAVLVLSDDDNLHPEFIEKTARLMEQGYDIVYTDLQRFGMENDVLIGADYTEENFKVSTVPWMTSLIRKSVFDRVGGWDPAQAYQDYDFYYRCFKAGAKGVCLHEPLFQYRVHLAAGSFNMNHAEAKQQMKAKHAEIKSTAWQQVKGRIGRILGLSRQILREIVG